jgi:glutaredoxin
MDADPILYIKRGCPYCRAAAAFFSTHGVSVQVRDVASSSALRQLIKTTEQAEVPAFVCGDFVISGFDVDQLLDELAERPDVRLRLGLGDHDDEL